MTDRQSIDRFSRGASARFSLTDFLYPLPAKRSVGGIVKWWERRRLGYNAIVGACGALSTSVITGLNLLLGGRVSVSEAFGPALVVLVVANICYTLGPITEAVLHKIWGNEVRPVGPHLFRAGLTFSVGLTLFVPMVAAFVMIVAQVIQLF